MGFMTDDEMNKIVDAWVAYNELGKVDVNSEYSWAEETVMNWHLERDDESLLIFILAVYGRKMSDRAFAGLAAGPLEGLLADHGSKYIDRVETFARRDQN